MEEAQHIRGPADLARINVDEEHELLHRTMSLGVSETKLRAAVAFAGVMASDVHAYLGIASAQADAGPCRPGLSNRTESCSAAEVTAALVPLRSRPNVRSLANVIRSPPVGKVR